jgi:hypothetical protein
MGASPEAPIRGQGARRPRQVCRAPHPSPDRGCPLPEAQAIWHATTGLDAPGDRRDPSPASVQGLGGQFLLQGACLATGLLHRHADRHLGKRAHEQAQLLPQPTPHRQGRRGCRSHPLVMEAASTRVTEHEDREGHMDQQDILTVWSFFLPFSHAVCSAGSWEQTMRRSVPSWVQGGTPVRRLGRRRRAVVPPPVA